LNGGDNAARELRSFQFLKDSVHVVSGLTTLLLAVVLLGPVAQRALQALGKLKEKPGADAQRLALIALGLMPLLLTGCIKPYDRPEYVEIDTSDTGFLIPLEGDGSQQAKFQSEDYLKQRKVAAKRVQIMHRWSQEGRLGNTGRWIPTVRLVK